MTYRSVTVMLRASVSDYTAKMAAAGRATQDLANKVDLAKGRAAEGYKIIGSGLLVAGGAVAVGFGEAIKAAASFDSKMALVRTLSKATAGQMGELRNAALTVGQAYGYTANDVADAEAELVKAGISVSDIMGGALTGALTLAAAGQTDVATATEIAAAAMTQFQLKGADIPHVADLLAAGADKALGSITDLGYGLAAVGTTAHQYGITIDETVGTLAALAQAGQIGSRGGTELNQMLLKLAAPGHAASVEMKTLGINAYDASGQFVGLTNFAGQLHDKLGPLTQAQRTHAEAVIFGSRAIKAANVLYQDGAAGIADWTKKVDAAGFAELQAAGKLDSLSGDWQKFTAALQTALIGAGEGSQGVLRGIVQDATGAVDAWNRLPAPIKSVATDLTALGGATLLAGGLALLSVSKWNALNVALEDAGVGAISAKSALMGIGKTGAVGGVVLGIAYGVDKLAESIGQAVPKINQVENSLVNFARTGQVGGALLTLYGQKLHYLSDDIKAINDPSTMQSLEHAFDPTRIFGQGKLNTIDLSKQRLDSVDKALADLTQNGHAELARQAFDRLTEAEVAQGGKASWLAGRLHNYSNAVNQSRTVAQIAAHAQQTFGATMLTAAKHTGEATAAAKDYNDALHALYDPVFAFQQALGDLRGKQQAYNQAVKKFGPDSKAARSALGDVATATLNVTTNANSLAASLKDSPGLMGKFVDQLAQWRSQGLITGGELNALTGLVKGLLDKAGNLDGANYNFNVHANTSQASAHLTALERQLAGLHGKTINVKTVNTDQHVGGKVGGSMGGRLLLTNAYGGWIPGHGRPHADDLLSRVSSGEFVVNAQDAARNGPLLEAINSGARIAAIPPQRNIVAMASGQRPNTTYNVEVNNPTPEKASESVPRVLRDQAFLSGAAW